MEKCFIDTNILVYMADDRNVEKQKIALNFFTKLIKKYEVYISTQVLQELYNVYTTKLKLDNATSEKLVKNYFNLNVVQVNIPIIETAMKIHDNTQFSFWDALVISAAVSEDCTVLYSEDLNNGQVVDGVKIVNPFL